MRDNHAEDYEPLESLLRENETQVEDDNFTARVMSALPRRQSRVWLRPVLLFSSALAGLVMAVMWLPWGALRVVEYPVAQSADARWSSSWLLTLSVMLSLILAITAAIQGDTSQRYLNSVDAEAE